MSCSKQIRLDVVLSPIFHSDTYLTLITSNLTLQDIILTVHKLSKFHSSFLFKKNNKQLLQRLILYFYNDIIFNIEDIKILFKNDRKKLIQKLFSKYKIMLDTFAQTSFADFRINEAYLNLNGLIYWYNRKDNHHRFDEHEIDLMLYNVCCKWEFKYENFIKFFDYFVHKTDFKFKLDEILLQLRGLLARHNPMIEHAKYLMLILMYNSKKLSNVASQDFERRISFLLLHLTLQDILRAYNLINKTDLPLSRDEIEIYLQTANKYEIMKLLKVLLSFFPKQVFTFIRNECPQIISSKVNYFQNTPQICHQISDLLYNTLLLQTRTKLKLKYQLKLKLSLDGFKKFINDNV